MSSEEPTTIDLNRHWSSVGIDSAEQCEELALEAIKGSNVIAMDLVEFAWPDGSTEKNCLVFALDQDEDITVLSHVASGNEDDDFELLTTTPAVSSSYGYEFQFESAADYRGPTEGLIQGQPLTFVDPLYLTNRDMLETGDEISISLSAIAYELSKIPGDEVVLIEDPEIIRAMAPDESEGKTDDELEPIEVEVAGTVSLLPREDAEYDLISIVQEVEEITAFGKEFFRLGVGLMATDDYEDIDDLMVEEVEEEDSSDGSVEEDDLEGEEDEELEYEEEVIPMTLYVLKSNCKDGYVPVVGDAIEASIWLQGVILDEDEDDEEDEDESESSPFIQPAP